MNNKIGALISIHADRDKYIAEWEKLHELDLHSCQLCTFNEDLMTEENAVIALEYSKKYDIEISAFWCGWDGPQEWNFYDGPLTLGLVPETYRAERLRQLKKGAHYAVRLGTTDMITHVGFIPETPNTAEWRSLVACLKDLANYCKDLGINFLFETGQETPTTLLRTIQAIGTDNLGINLDPANLIAYGKGNPVDALLVFGQYVRNIHGKDYLYPVDPWHFNDEVPLGQGHVNYPAFIDKLHEIGYKGPITIEREIHGDEQKKDILMAKKLLEDLMARYDD